MGWEIISRPFSDIEKPSFSPRGGLGPLIPTTHPLIRRIFAPSGGRGVWEFSLLEISPDITWIFEMVRHLRIPHSAATEKFLMLVWGIGGGLDGSTFRLGGY